MTRAPVLAAKSSTQRGGDAETQRSPGSSCEGSAGQKPYFTTNRTKDTKRAKIIHGTTSKFIEMREAIDCAFGAFSTETSRVVAQRVCRRAASKAQ